MIFLRRYVMAAKIPSHIKESGRKWLNGVLAEYDVPQNDLSSSKRSALFMAAECLDRLREVREQIGKDGLQVPDRFGVMRAHPLCAVERDNRLTFIRITRQLGIIDKFKNIDCEKEQTPLEKAGFGNV
jgi:hypothetical protein